jgi:hypothetical protein
MPIDFTTVAPTEEKSKKEDVGFFESALAGVATGLWNIPKGFVSLGAEIYDAVKDTDTAKDVEQWFDDVNPWDDEAEARTVGKITQAITQIGIPAVQGAKIGSALASRALAAKKSGNFINLGKIGEKIMASEKGVRLTGMVVGGGVGEALVADEDIGTFADMVKGTSLEPYAITMMDTEEKEGREEAFRRLKNRLKFGTEGALFNLALIGAGKGIQKLRKPLEESPKEYLGGAEEFLQKFGLEGGFRPEGLGTKGLFESKEYFKGRQKVVDVAANNIVKTVDKNLKNLDDAFYNNYLKEGQLRSTTDAVEKTGQDLLRKDLYDIVNPSGSYDSLLKPEAKKRVTEQLKLLKNFNEIENEYLKTGTLGPVLNKVKKNYVDDAVKTARDRFINAKIDLLPNPQKVTIAQRAAFEQEAKRVIKFNSQEIKQLEREAFADIDLLDVNKRTESLGRQATKEEVAQIEKQAFDTLEEFNKKIIQKGAFTLDDYAVTPKLKNILDKIGKSGKGNVEELKNSIIDMRASLDNLSGSLYLKNVADDKAKTVLNNLGRYTTAVYRRKETQGLIGLGDYKVTADEILKGENKYVDLKLKEMRRKYVNQQIVSLNRAASPEELLQFEKEAIENVAFKPNELQTIREEARGAVAKFAKQVNADEVGPLDINKSNVSKSELEDVRINNEIIRDKVLNPWQEEVFGIIRDPSYSFFSAAGKLANLNFTVDYLNNIYKQGSKINGFIKSAQELKAIDPSGSLLQNEKKWKLFQGDPNIKTPLDGLYIEAPKYDAIFDVTSNWLNKSGVGTFYKYAVLAPKAGSQIAKTILSPLTHVRNLLSASAFVAANGAFFPNYGDIKQLLPKVLGGENVFSKAFDLSGKRVFGTMTKADEALYQRLLKVGVVDSQVQAGEMKRLLRDILTDPAAVEKGLYDKLPKTLANKSKKTLAEVYGKLQDAYVAEDDFWKVINWSLERNRYSGIINNLGVNQDNVVKILSGDQEALKGIKNGQAVSDYFRKIAPRVDYINSGTTQKEIFENFLDEVAGNLTRNQVPNYAYIGRTGRALRQTPFGNFIAFPIEIMRTGHNIFQQSIDEITSGIPELVGLGYKRLFSFGATIGGVPYALSETFKAKNDVTNEEMNALRRVGVPEWSKNSTLLVTGKNEKGYPKYIDFSYSNAYDSLIRPFNAIVNSISNGVENKESLMKSLGEGMMDSMNELLKPYATESIFTEALIDSTFRRGYGREGKRIWNDNDETMVKIGKGVLHIAETFKPGSYDQIKRLGQAATGKTDKYGNLYKLSDEISSLYSMREIQSDPEKSLIYITTRFSKDLDNSKNIFNAPLLKGGRVSPEEITESYNYSESRRFNTLKEMYKNIEAARLLGVSESKIRKQTTRPGIKKDVLNNLYRGVYTPEEPSKFFKERIAQINRDLNRKEGVDMPNPYTEAMPLIRETIRKNRRLKLLDNEFKFLDIPSIMQQEQPQPQPQPITKQQAFVPPTGQAVVPPTNVAQTTNVAFNQQFANLFPGDTLSQLAANKRSGIV